MLDTGRFLYSGQKMLKYHLRGAFKSEYKRDASVTELDAVVSG